MYYLKKMFIFRIILCRSDFALDTSNKAADGYLKKYKKSSHKCQVMKTFTKFNNKYYVIKGIQYYVVKPDKTIDLKGPNIQDKMNPNKFHNIWILNSKI